MNRPKLAWLASALIAGLLLWFFAWASQNLDKAKTAADLFQSVLTALGIIVGGLWAVYRFIIQRESETAIDIDISSTVPEKGARQGITFLDVVFHNRGKRRVLVPPKKITSGITLALSPISGGAVEKVLDWSRNAAPQDISYQTSINLLHEYQLHNPHEGFWLEPDEMYHFGTAVTLKPGDYLVKVTFVGSREGEFWMRIFLINVP